MRRAVVFERGTQGGGQYTWPVRIYLALVEVDSEGKPRVPKKIPTNMRFDDAGVPLWCRVEDNKRATRRFSETLARFDAAASAYNTGVATWPESLANAKQQL
ncbi:MAG: hypothetical protein Q8M09_02660 [Pseudomonadota bacterium]|nr:hypothetical protein [Pseudomonadota bacterium]MDP1572984.1 hypothetical protein [Pseudomonadota bacterium]MDP1903142.1 hypothetical protein [Pseudomonadota bacterium]